MTRKEKGAGMTKKIHGKARGSIKYLLQYLYLTILTESTSTSVENQSLSISPRI